MFKYSQIGTFDAYFLSLALSISLDEDRELTILKSDSDLLKKFCLLLY